MSTEVGREQLKQFEASWPAGFYNTLLKQVVTFAERTKRISVGERAIVDQEAIYARVIGLLVSQHDLDLQQVLATELTAYPPSMFQADGEMQVATGKSTLKNSLKVEVSQRLITSPTAIVIDVSAVLWTATDNNYSLDTHTKWHFPTLININARSLSTEKRDELQAIVDLYNVSIVCITETWFKEYIGDESVSLYGYNLERKDRTHGRAGGVACYVRNDVLYKRLDSLEVPELEVIWIKIMPTKLPRKFSCILVACVYYTQHTDYSQMRYHLIMGIDTMIRKHPECGVIITCDFNQLNDNFLKVHYRFVQVVNVVTRGQATLDKIWTNMNGFYSTPVSISELGTSDHCMVLWKPDRGPPDIRGNVTRVTVKCMGPSEKAAFAMGVASIRWEPLFRLTTCEEKYSYYQTIVNSLMEHCFPIKAVTRHTADKPWITDLFRNLKAKI